MEITSREDPAKWKKTVKPFRTFANPDMGMGEFYYYISQLKEENVEIYSNERHNLQRAAFQKQKNNC
jgi:hypothetical protein